MTNTNIESSNRPSFSHVQTDHGTAKDIAGKALKIAPLLIPILTACGVTATLEQQIQKDQSIITKDIASRGIKPKSLIPIPMYNTDGIGDGENAMIIEAQIYGIKHKDSTEGKLGWFAAILGSDNQITYHYARSTSIVENKNEDKITSFVIKIGEEKDGKIVDKLDFLKVDFKRTVTSQELKSFSDQQFDEVTETITMETPDGRKIILHIDKMNEEDRGKVMAMIRPTMPSKEADQSTAVPTVYPTATYIIPTPFPTNTPPPTATIMPTPTDKDIPKSTNTAIPSPLTTPEPTPSKTPSASPTRKVDATPSATPDSSIVVSNDLVVIKDTNPDYNIEVKEGGVEAMSEAWKLTLQDIAAKTGQTAELEAGKPIEINIPISTSGGDSPVTLREIIVDPNAPPVVELGDYKIKRLDAVSRTGSRLILYSPVPETKGVKITMYLEPKYIKYGTYSKFNNSLKAALVWLYEGKPIDIDDEIQNTMPHFTQVRELLLGPEKNEKGEVIPSNPSIIVVKN